MYTRFPTIFLVISVCLILLIAGWGFARIILLDRFQSLETNQIENDALQLQRFVANTFDEMHFSIDEWLNFHENNASLQTKDSSFWEVSRLENTFHILRVDFIEYYDQNLQFLSGGKIDQSIREPFLFSDELISPGQLYFDPNNETSFAVTMGEDVFLIVLHPLYQSDQIWGYILFGKELRNSSLDQLVKTMGYPIGILTQANDATQFEKLSNKAQAENNAIVIEADSMSEITGNYSLLGSNHTIVAILQIKQPRVIYKQGVTSLNWIVFMNIMFGVILTGLIIYFLDRYIVRLLKEIRSEFPNITNFEKLEKNKHGILGNLGRTVNLVFSAAKAAQLKGTSQQRIYSKLIEQSKDGYALIDGVDKKIKYANPRFCELLNTKNKNPVGENILHYLSSINSNSGFISALEKVLDQKKSAGESRWLIEVDDDQKESRLLEIMVEKSKDLAESTINLIAREIPAYKEVSSLMQRKLIETSMINRILSSTIRSMDLHLILKSVCAELAEAFRVEAPSYASINELDQPLRFYRVLPKNEGKEVFFIIDYSKNQEFLAGLENHTAFVLPIIEEVRSAKRNRNSFNSIMIVPIFVSNEIVGVIRLAHRGSERFSPDQLELATQVAMIASQVIEIARLYSDVNHELLQRKMIEETLEKRERYFSTIVQIQAALLSSDEEEMIDRAVLQQLGEISGASRIYYYQDFPGSQGSRYAVRQMQWSADNFNFDASTLFPQKVDYTKIPAWVGKLRKGEIVSGKVADLLPAYPKDIKTLLLLPILMSGKYVGFIGFDNCTDDHAWDEMEVALLQVATSSLALAQERKQAVKALLQSQTGQLLMLDQLPALLIHIDPNYTITSIRGSWLRSLGKNEEEAVSLVKKNIKKDKNIENALKKAMVGIRISFESHWDGYTLQMYLEPLKDDTSKIIGVIILALDISERKRSEDSLRRSEESIRSLYTITSSKELDYSQKIRSLLMMGCQHYSADVGLISEIDSTRAIMKYSYSHGLKVVPGTPLDLSDTLDLEILRSNQPIYINSGSNSNLRYQSIVQKRQIKAFIGARIEIAGKPSWTISFISLQPHRNPLAASDYEFLRLMAQWVGAELEREENIEKIQLYAEEISRNSLALANARDQALDATRMKSEFLATMSHEIRTPLNSVIGMTELLLDSSINAEQREYAMVARDSAQILLSLISDILDFSKIEAGKVELESIEFDPTQTVEGVVDLFSANARDKGISLMSFVDPEIPKKLEGDPVRLKQILINLVANALKFTNSGEILVNMILKEQNSGFSEVKVEVSDTGIGIRPSVQHLLFQPFTQADGSTTRKYGGTGLGLAISKRLVELMRGEIGFKSKPGQGSTFFFTARFNTSNDLEKSQELSDEHVMLGVPILVVENNPAHRAVLASYFKSWKMKPFLSEDGNTALSMYEASKKEGKPFQLVMVDMQLPDLDGLALADELRRHSEGKALQLILVAAFDQRGMSKKAMESGISAYLVKPIKQSLLFNTINNLLNKAIPIEKAPGRTSLENKSHQVSGKDLKQIRILLAEDNPANRKLAIIQMEKLGYSVDSVENGKKALEKISEEPGNYAVVFMDCQMPEMDGFEATRLIRKLEKNNGVHTPIIAMTANALEEDQKICKDAGMDDYISKPVTMKVLAEMLEHWSKPFRDKNQAGQDS